MYIYLLMVRQCFIKPHRCFIKRAPRFIKPCCAYIADDFSGAAEPMFLFGSIRRGGVWEIIHIHIYIYIYIQFILPTNKNLKGGVGCI